MTGSGGENADGKWSEEKIDGEESVRTVVCLRGRLLAERVASRNAKMEAEHLGNKLTELENLLKKEGKSRNRAEKKLKSLMKKLESKNISYDSSESGLLDRSDITSTSSSSTASSKSEDKISKNSQMKNFPVCSVESSKLPIEFDHLKRNDSQPCISSESHGSPVTEKNCTSSELDIKQGHRRRGTEAERLPCPVFRADSFLEGMDPLCQNPGRTGEFEYNQNYNIASTEESESHGSPVTEKNCTSSELDIKQGHRRRGTEAERLPCPVFRADSFLEGMDPLCQNPGRTGEFEYNQNYNIASTEESVYPSAEEEVNQENDQDQEKNQQNDEDEENHVDNSLALVPVEKRETKQTIDPEVLDATVKEVLDALRHAKEQLQSSMERRRRHTNMIKVG